MDAKVRLLTTKEFNKYRNFLPKNWYDSKKWYLQGENDFLIYDLETQTIRPPKSTNEKAFFTEVVEISFPHNYKTGDRFDLSFEYKIPTGNCSLPFDFIQPRKYFYIDSDVAFGEGNGIFRTAITIEELDYYLKTIRLNRF